MKIGIVGWGIEGQSAYRYFGPEHSYLIVNEHPRDDFPQQNEKIQVQFVDKERSPGLTSNVADISYLNGLESCDKIIYTPTSRKNLEKIYPPENSFWERATTDRHIFFESVKTKNIIGITGTKGKGTTATLVAKMLEASGKRVHLAGNIGKGVLDIITQVEPEDWVVLELSSFQLYKFSYSPHIAVCLMIIPEHMDWHPDMDEYVDAKSNIFRHQSRSDIAIYFSRNQYSAKIAELSKGQKIPYFEKPGAYVRYDGMIVVGGDETIIAHKKEVKLLGNHNLQNVCAAITAVWQVAPLGGAISSVLNSFSGLPHRLELVREFGGVKYYDDSFGTTPDTAVVAMQAFEQPKVMILGGSDKGVTFDELADEVIKNKVRHVIAIGNTGPVIAGLLRQRGFTNITDGRSTMPEIVEAARKVAQPGDVVLLSTGCASFGLFKNYQDRGEQFKSAVLALA